LNNFLLKAIKSIIQKWEFEIELYFIFRTLAETAMAAGLLAWLILFGVPAIKLDEIIYCETHGYLFECAGHPQVCKMVRLG
jgi:hypothetical protein